MLCTCVELPEPVQHVARFLPPVSYFFIGLARTIHIRYFWQGNYQIYGRIGCIYTVLANPTYLLCSTACVRVDPVGEPCAAIATDCQTVADNTPSS